MALFSVFYDETVVEQLYGSVQLSYVISGRNNTIELCSVGMNDIDYDHIAKVSLEAPLSYPEVK